ncbi:hypothetical protein C8R45DRAFT_1097957 [Mycena sanguinolenta]|nr:hypothetical protein C8R45DRAFT_1097957 [Mycena sanguinolenta]
MSTDQRNNGNATPPSTPSGNKDKDKNPEMEEQEEEVTEEEKKQQKLEALMRILDVEEKKANERLERIRRERERASALSQDIKAHRLDDHGEVELADLLCGSSPRGAPPEKDGGKKQHRVEKKGKGKQLGRPEKRRRMEKMLPETVDPEVRRLDEADAWVDGEASCQLCTQSGVQCLWPPANSRKKACHYCRLWKVKCTNLPENENGQLTVRCRVPEDLGIAWACQYLHGIGENTDGESKLSSEEEEMEETKRVRSWVKKVDASEKEENLRSEDGHGGVDRDGDVEMEDPSTETTDGPSTFGPFVTTSNGTVFHINLESTTVVVKTEEEDLVRRGRLRKKNKVKAKAKATGAENTEEKGPETEVKTEEQETQVPVTVQPPVPRVIQGPGVFFETATSTGKLIPVQVEMIKVLDSDDEALAP